MPGKSIKIKKEGSKQIFNNPILERLTRTHISVPLIIFYGFSGSIMVYTNLFTSMPFYMTLAFFILGLLSFTLIEYLIHKYVFHMMEDTPLKEKIQYACHGVHHEYPNDKKRLAMPPLFSVIIGLLFFLLFKTLMGIPGMPFDAGFMSGYATYLLVHYSVHAYKPPKNFLRILWRYHNIHHYKDHSVAYGVSSPLWDAIFGTLPKKRRYS